MTKDARSYEEGLHERLRDITHAVNYINAAAEEGSIEGFLLALRDVAEATKGMSGLADAADKNRENLYRMLSREGNPRLDSLWAVLHAMGLRVSVAPIEEDQTGGITTPINDGFVHSSERLLADGNSLSVGGRDSADDLLGFGMISTPEQARKAPGPALENFAGAGQLATAEKSGAIIGRP
jgi:probable addiction module antidote protein